MWRNGAYKLLTGAVFKRDIQTIQGISRALIPFPAILKDGERGVDFGVVWSCDVLRRAWRERMWGPSFATSATMTSSQVTGIAHGRYSGQPCGKASRGVGVLSYSC